MREILDVLMRQQRLVCEVVDVAEKYLLVQQHDENLARINYARADHFVREREVQKLLEVDLLALLLALG